MEAVRLEAMGEAHVEAIDDLLADPEVLRFTRVPEPPPPGFARHWLGRYEAGRRDGTREGSAALDAEGRFLGLGLAPEIDRDAHGVELGYIVAAGARGRGVATEILRMLSDWAQCGALRIYLIIDVANPASERVAERCGYSREGVMRSVHVKPGVRADAALWSRLASDRDHSTPGEDQGAGSSTGRERGSRIGA